MAEEPAIAAVRSTDGQNVGDMQASTSLGGDRRLGLRSSALWSIAGSVSFSGTNFLAQIVLARQANSAEVGRYALATAVVAPAAQLALPHLRAAFVADARGDYSVLAYASLRRYGIIAAALAMVLWSFLGGMQPDVIPVLAFLGLTTLFDAASDFIFAVMQRAERMDLVSISMVLRNWGGVALFIWALIAFRDVGYAAGGWAAGSLITLLAFDLPQLRRMDCAYSPSCAGRAGVLPLFLSGRSAKADIAGLVKSTWPLAATLIVATCQTSIPRFVIERDLNRSAVGVFAVLFMLTVPARTISVAIGIGLSARMASAYANHDREQFKSILLKFLAVSAAIGATASALFVVGSPILVPALFGREYSTQPALLAWLQIWAWVICIAGALGVGATSSKRYLIQPFVTTASAVVALVLCILLVPSMGLTGAGVAMTASGIIALLGFTIPVMQALKDRGGGR